MDASSFLCALRRFFAIRGPALRLRCDRGTNLVGAKTEIDQALAEMDKESVASYLSEQGCEWLFNPPHASHFGGAWERQIGTIRRILDAMLLELGSSQLTHELLVTLMSEVAAIVNSRPITAIPSDIDEPQPLSPAMLLTQKTRSLGPLPGSYTARDQYARQRWRRVQFLADQFWTEYINNLQARKKSTQESRYLTVGDIVLIKEDQDHWNNWPLARVVSAAKSSDGSVRKATHSICIAWISSVQSTGRLYNLTAQLVNNTILGKEIMHKWRKPYPCKTGLEERIKLYVHARWVTGFASSKYVLYATDSAYRELHGKITDRKRKLC